MIPKLIHQTARTPDIPADCRAYVEKLRALHPDWTYRLWTDEDNLELVRTRMPAAFLEVYQKLPRNIMRADVIRYVYMYVLGGLYLDTDYEMLRPFDLLEHDVVLPRETDETRGPDGVVTDEGRIANSIFAAAPGHPFWKRVLDDLTARPPLAVADDEVLSATGPLFLTRLCHAARRDGMVIYLPDAIVFNPTTPRTTSQYKAIVNNGRSQGIHHCVGSWRQFTVKDRIKNRVWKVLGKLS